MNRLNFITGIALLVVAATLALTITVRRPARVDRPESMALPGGAGSSSGSARRGADADAEAWRLKERTVFAITAPADHPDREALEVAAGKVEAEARRQLDRLTEQLLLSGEQRRIIFPILARTSDFYDPAMLMGGIAHRAAPLSAPAGKDEVRQALDPAQRDQLIEDSMAELALWKEIIGQLQKELEAQTPEVPSPNGGGGAAEPAHPRRNLRDIMRETP